MAVFYGSYSVADDMAWGAMWLYNATRQQMWLDTVCCRSIQIATLRHARGAGDLRLTHARTLPCQLLCGKHACNCMPCRAARKEIGVHLR